MDNHLSRPTVADGLMPPPESGRAGLASLKRCSPTVLLRIEFTAARCLQPPGELLPRLSTLTSSCYENEAVYLCCTGPEVAFGGRYPLSLPYGARTFLVSGLSPSLRGCPAYSHCYFIPVSNLCQIKSNFPIKSGEMIWK